MSNWIKTRTPGDQGGANAMSITEDQVEAALRDLSRDDQLALVQRLASNIGYVLTPEPAPFDREPPSKPPALFTIDGVEFLEQDVPEAQVAWRVRFDGDEFYVCCGATEFIGDGFAALVAQARAVYGRRRADGKPPTWPKP